MAAKDAALALFRNLLREGGRIRDYNFRSYAKRRARLGFEQSRDLRPGAEHDKAFAFGREQLELVRRQAVMSSMYTHEKSVMESIAESRRR